MATHRTSLSFHDKIWKLANQLADEEGFTSISDFVAHAIREYARMKALQSKTPESCYSLNELPKAEQPPSQTNGRK